MPKQTICFISGHLDLTEEEFQTQYVPTLYAMIQRNHAFIVGDAKGADVMAQRYLALKAPDECPVTVYHMHDAPRYNVGNFSIQGGFDSDNERDAAMTADSHVDLAWVRPGREKSGTARNLKRRNRKPPPLSYNSKDIILNLLSTEMGPIWDELVDWPRNAQQPDEDYKEMMTILHAKLLKAYCEVSKIPDR